MSSQNEDFIEQMIHRKDKSYVNFALIGINVVIFILMQISGGTADSFNMISWGAAYTPLIEAGEYYRLFTSMFLHFGIQHLFSNMLLLFFVGDYMERYLGKIKYLILYLSGGFLGNLFSYYIEVRSKDVSVSAGASGAIFAVVGSLAVAALLNKGRLFELSFSRIMIMAILTLWSGFTSSGIDAFAHLGGFIGGGIIAFILILPHQKET